MTKELVLPPGIRDEVLKHLKRAGHNEMGESHVVYPEPGEWDIEMDKPGCMWGLWLLDSESDTVADEEFGDEEDAPRTQCNECTCGYSDVLNLFEPGKEEDDRLAKIEQEIWVKRAVANREHNMNQIGAYLIENDPEWAPVS